MLQINLSQISTYIPLTYIGVKCIFHIIDIKCILSISSSGTKIDDIIKVNAAWLSMYTTGMINTSSIF